MRAGHEESIRAGRATAPAAALTSDRIPTIDSTSDWLGKVGGAFVAGGAAVLAWLGIGLWQTVRIRRQSRPAAHWSREVLAQIVGDGGAAPDLLVSGWLAQPVAVGLLRPAIILPERFVEDEPRCRFEAALAHEWGHFRNRDLWWIALSGLLMPVLFAHPAYWWLRRRSREDQELLADAAAADGRGDYAEALLAWARQTPDRPRLTAVGSLALWERPSQLKTRILTLLDGDFRLEPTCPRRFSVFVRGATALVVLALSVLSFRPAAVAAGADRPGPQSGRESRSNEDEALGSGATVNPGSSAELRNRLLPVRRLRGHTALIGELVFSPDGRQALSCSADGTICLWEIDTGEKVRTLFGHRGAVQSVVFSRDGRRALSSGSDATVRYWDIDKGEELQRFEGHSGIVYSAVFAGDERRVLTCGQDRTLRLLGRGDRSATEDSGCESNRPIRSIAVSHDDRRALSGGDDGIGRVWDPATGAELHRLEGHTGQIWHKAGDFAGWPSTTAGQSRTILMWDCGPAHLSAVSWARRRRPATGGVHRLEGHTGQIWHVAISPDGQMGLTAGQDRTILMWDLRTGTLVRGFLGHEGDVNNLVFSPDGKRFLSVSDDQTLRLWDVGTGKELSRSTGHVSHVGAVAISRDGKLSLTGGDDTRIRLWRMPE